MRRQGQDEGFLWIHKNGNSETLSRSGNTETYRILSHVRSRRQKQKGSDRAWMSHVSRLDLDTQSTDDKASTASEAARALAGPPKPSVHHNIMTGNVPGRPTLSIQFPCYNSSDPFHCTVLGMDATTSMRVIGNSVSSRISRVTFLAEALASPHLIAQNMYHRHDKFRHERLRACVSSELLMCSSIAHGTSSHAWFNGTIGDESSRYYVTKTLTAVRANLSYPDTGLSKSLLLSIYTLAISELWNAIPHMWQRNSYAVRLPHLQACKMHLRALLVLIHKGGGWATVSPYVLEGMLLMDKYAAMYHMDKPIIPLSWDSGPTPPEIRMVRHPSMINSQYHGCGFQMLDIESRFMDALQSMATFIHIATHVWGPRALSANSESWLYLKLHTFYYRILLHKHQTEVEYAVKVAALIAALNLVAYPGGEFFAQVLLGRLRTALEALKTKTSELDVSFRLWCLCTGAIVKGESQQKTWFIEELADFVVVNSLSLRLDTMSLKLQAYCYVPERQDADLSTLLMVLHSTRLSEH